MTLDNPLIKKQKLIICEGKMDRLIIDRLVKARSIESNFDIVDAGSKDSIYQKISEAIIADRKYILILADNDEDPTKAFKDIQNQITKGGATPPLTPKLLIDKPLALDVLMLPDTGEIGAIEWLALDVFNRYMKNKTCVDAFVNCITNEGKWLPQQRDKLSLAAYVAGSKHKNPDISIADYFGNGVKDIPNFYADPIFDTLSAYLSTFSKV